jgi:exosortase
LARLWRLWTTGFLGFFGGETATHGLPLLLVVAYLVYRRWREVQPVLDVRLRWGGVAVLAALALLWTFGGSAQIPVVQDLAVFLMVFPIVWLLYGYRLGATLSLPLWLMITAVPFWDALAPLHQQVTATASATILNGLGISTLREGFTLSVPAGDFQVNASCAGIRQLTSALAVAGLYAYLERLSTLGWAGLLIMAWMTALVANLLRVVIIVALGEATAMQHPLVSDHGWVGWGLFAIGITVLLVAVGHRLPRSRPRALSLASTPA